MVILIFVLLTVIIVTVLFVGLSINHRFHSIKKEENVIFVTYGDQKFIKSRNRIAKEALKSKMFTDVIIETENIFKDDEMKKRLKNQEYKKVITSKRGGGYWMWKPYIIKKNLDKLNDGDILVYCDSGSTLIKNEHTIKLFNQYIDDVKKTQSGIVVFYGNKTWIEKNWTKGDVFSFFDISLQDELVETPQVEAGVVIICKNLISKKIIEEWDEICVKKSHLLDDMDSLEKNHEQFIQNRHDQSILSILCKKNDCDIKWHDNNDFFIVLFLN